MRQLAGIVLLLFLQAAANAKDDSRFTQALAEATRLSDTPEGKAYDNEFSKVVAPQLGDIVNECTKGFGPRIDFQVVFIFAADGHVQDVLTASDQPGAKCVGERLRNLRLPAPPRADWPLRLGINISPDNASKIRALDAKFAADSLKSASPPPAEKSAGGVSLLDGKLKIDVPPDFERDPDDPKEPKTVAKFTHQGEGGAWGEVLRGTHGLTPDKLDGYLKMRVAEYTKGFNWLPKDSHLEWLKKDIVTIDGRKWADWRYVPMKKGMKDYRNSPVYTRFLTTSYKGQLLEITFTSNLTTDPKLKEEIDHIMDSVHLEE
jgi:hypothetical protein